MNTSTVFPRHDARSYEVAEHDIVTCPPDLWPLIHNWRFERRVAQIRTSTEALS